MLFIGCKENPKVKESKSKKVEYDISFDSNKNIIELNIDTFDNFNRMVVALEKSICDKKLTVIRFENDSTIYKIKPINFCPDDDINFDYYLRDVIWLTYDSIIVNQNIRFSIDSLCPVLEKHLVNKNNDPDFGSQKSQNSYLKNGFIKVNIDSTKTISEVKQIFQKLTNDFIDLNKQYRDSLKLYIELEKEPSYKWMSD